MSQRSLDGHSNQWTKKNSNIIAQTSRNPPKYLHQKPSIHTSTASPFFFKNQPKPYAYSKEQQPIHCFPTKPPPPFDSNKRNRWAHLFPNAQMVRAGIISLSCSQSILFVSKTRPIRLFEFIATPDLMLNVRARNKE